MGSIQRMRQMFNGGTRRIERKGFFSGALSILQCFRPKTRLIEMVSQVCQMCLMQGWGRGEGFECFRNRAMQRPAFTCQQLAVDRLSNQRVPEGELICRLLDDKLGRNQLLHYCN